MSQMFQKWINGFYMRMVHRNNRWDKIFCILIQMVEIFEFNVEFHVSRIHKFGSKLNCNIIFNEEMKLLKSTVIYVNDKTLEYGFGWKHWKVSSKLFANILMLPKICFNFSNNIASTWNHIFLVVKFIWTVNQPSWEYNFAFVFEFFTLSKLWRIVE